MFQGIINMIGEKLENLQKYVKAGWDMGMTPPPLWDNVPNFGVFFGGLVPLRKMRKLENR